MHVGYEEGRGVLEQARKKRQTEVEQVLQGVVDSMMAEHSVAHVYGGISVVTCWSYF